MKAALLALRTQVLREPVMLAGAALGFALAGIAAVVLLVHGPTVGAEGHVDRAMTFNFAVALYFLTLAIVVPLAKMSPRAHRRWALANAINFPVFYAIENVQVYRGVDPRFTEVGSPLDEAIGGFFGLLAIVTIVLFIIVAVRWFRRAPTDARDHLLLLGARYGAAGVGVAFAAGIGMSALSGSAVGDQGDLLLVHALGFHALQAIPLVGWLAGVEAGTGRAAFRVHLAGAAWLLATVAVGYQATSGNASFEASPANVLAVAALLVWLAIAADTARMRFMPPTGRALPGAAS
jgi:hypothetical protein